MSIPDKIYICSVMAIDSDDGTYFVDEYPSDTAIEYTLTPIAKKFADEKPKEDGYYLCKYNLDDRWYSLKYSDGIWFSESYDEWRDPVFYAPIIFPKLPTSAVE